MEKKEKNDAIPVEAVAVEKKVVEQKVQPKPVQVKRKRFGIKLLFWLIVIGTFGGAFALLGVYVSQNIIPTAQQWLVSHNFRGFGGTNGQEKSPFIPQPSDSATNNVSLTIPQVVKKSASSVAALDLTVNPAPREGPD